MEKGQLFQWSWNYKGNSLNKKDNVAVVQSPVYLFCPTALDHTPSQLLDKSNHMLNQANQIFYQTIYGSKYFMGQTRYSSKSWAFNSRFSFKVRQHGQQKVYLQHKVCWVLQEKSRSSFIFTTLIVHTTTSKTSTKYQFLCFSKSSPPYSTLTCLQNHPYNDPNHPPTNTPFFLSQKFCISWLLRTTSSTIFTKNIFPTLVI